MSYKTVNMLDIITCDKCGYKQSAICGEAGKVFFDSGWSFNRDAKKYVHKCGKCNGKKAPNVRWKAIEPLLLKHPLIKGIGNISS